MLSENLDFENVQKYTVIITAEDKGRPPLSSNLTLNLEVQDVNDNPPVFEKSEYAVSVLESLPANTEFLQVTAHDEDTGNNARLTYTIKEKQFERVFGIFPNSGSLYLKEVSFLITVTVYCIYPLINVILFIRLLKFNFS